MFTSTFFPQWTLLKIKGRQSFSPPSPLHFERGEEQGRFFKVLPSPEEEFYTRRREGGVCCSKMRRRRGKRHRFIHFTTFFDAPAQSPPPYTHVGQPWCVCGDFFWQFCVFLAAHVFFLEKEGRKVKSPLPSHLFQRKSLHKQGGGNRTSVCQELIPGRLLARLGLFFPRFYTV